MRNAIIGTAVLGVIAIAGLAAPGWAQEGARTEEHVERHVVIKRVGKDGKAPDHARHMAARHAQCTGEKVESDISVGEEGDKHRTRIVICGKGETTAELNRKLAEALEKARGRIGEHGEMSAERRSELLARIDAEIARVRARAD